jgi:hypothetical protein
MRAMNTEGDVGRLLSRRGFRERPAPRFAGAKAPATSARKILEDILRKFAHLTTNYQSGRLQKPYFLRGLWWLRVDNPALADAALLARRSSGSVFSALKAAALGEGSVQ